MTDKPSLYGLKNKNTNRDYSNKSTWGKNQFNSSFPTSLCCYMHSKNKNANYLKIEEEKITISELSFEHVFGLNPEDDNIFFSFESRFKTYDKYLRGTIPGTDLVILDSNSKKELRHLEIKLTTLPDNTTADLDEDCFGCELVVRPDTIVYLACSIIENCEISGFKLSEKLELFKKNGVYKGGSPAESLNNTCIFLETIALNMHNQPFLMQPIWKTLGKSAVLEEHCFDCFVWSSAALLKFIAENGRMNSSQNAKNINRKNRTVIWIKKMLDEYFDNGRFDHQEIIDSFSYNTKNDKAFAVSGTITNKYMKCDNLRKPRIKKTELKEIILNGGENFLSPERRLDSIITNSADLF